MSPFARQAVSLLVLPLAISCTGHAPERDDDEPATAPLLDVAEPVVEAAPEPAAAEEAIAEANDDAIATADAKTDDEATADAPPSQPKPRVRPRDRFPQNLYIAYPERDKGWVVDIIDLYGRNSDRVTAALGLTDDMWPDDVTLAPGGPGLPRGWKVGDTWTLVTRQGVLRRDVARYGIEQGAGELHVRVELARAKTRARKPVLAIRGTDVPADLVFDTPAPRDGSTLGEGGLERVRAAVVASSRDREMRRLYARARIAAGHVEIYDARLPDPWTAVVFLDAPSRAWGEPARASAMLFLAEDGALRHFSRPDVEGGRLRARAIVDVDGNGIDEVFYEDGYYEGSYEMVVWFDGDEPRERTLSGDGA